MHSSISELGDTGSRDPRATPLRSPLDYGVRHQLVVEETRVVGVHDPLVFRGDGGGSVTHGHREPGDLPLPGCRRGRRRTCRERSSANSEDPDGQGEGVLPWGGGRSDPVQGGDGVEGVDGGIGGRTTLKNFVHSF